jgi:predicted nuclease with TOPRIM domain
MSDKTVPLQEFVDEHNRLLDQLEVKEREKDGIKADWYDMKKERDRLREVLKWIVEHSVDYQAIIKARQALKGGE